MTENNGSKSEGKLAGGLLPFHLDASRSSRGMRLIFDGIIGISDFSAEIIQLLSHSGRVIVEGKRLKINVYENNAIEITGRVEDIKFGYGKH